MTRYLQCVLNSNDRSDTQIMEEVYGVTGLNSSLVSASADNAAVFQEPANKLDEMYLGVVQDALSPVFPADWCRAIACSDVIFVDRSRKVYPFGRQVADQAVWDTMGQRGIEGGKNYCISVGDADKSTRTCSWRAAYNNQLQVDVLIRKVARKFVTEACTIVACRIANYLASSPSQVCSTGVVIRPGQNPDKTAISSCYLMWSSNC